MAFGTRFTLDTNANLHDTTVREFSEERLYEQLRAFWDAHNLIFNQVSEFIAERTTDRLRTFGGTSTVNVQELDEFGQPSAQKSQIPGYNVGFPLRRYGAALQWTRDGFENMTLLEMANQINAFADADQTNLERQLRAALFGPTSYDFTDWQEMKELTLPVKPLLNADNLPIPIGPFGQTFDPNTHTHYHGVATQNTPLQAEVIALIDTVVEHFASGSMHLYINRAQELAVRGFSNFNAYLDARLVDQRAQLVATAPLNVTNLYDRAIGLLNAAEVHVKPWIPAGYMIAVNVGQEKPLVIRQPRATALQGFRVVAQDENYPLRATEWEHRFGVAVWRRSGAAVLDTVTGSSTYTAPALI